MANKAITKKARRAAREAAVAAQEELARRTRANVEDLATFFSARDRADAVDEWLADRQQLMRQQAAQRRTAQRVQCGRASRAMRDRGETLRELARMAGIAEKTVREMIKEADATPDAGAAAESAKQESEPAPPATVEAEPRIEELGLLVPHVNVGASERLAARAQA
jgi:hypothetical protein